MSTTPTTTPDHTLLATIKPHLPLVGSVLGFCSTAMLSAVLAYGSLQRKDATADMQAKDIERRVVVLENSAVTRREVEALSASFAEYKADSTRRFVRMEDSTRRVEDMLSQEVRFMRRDAAPK